MISVIIPAKDETYLQKTIEGALAASRGEIEVIAVCDGYWPDPIVLDEPRVNIIHHTKAVGQRRAVNEAAKLANGKYIFKVDAHCMFDEGFDVKLAKDCEYDWTVIPRMYVLDADLWQPKLRKMHDFMYFNAPWAEEDPMRIKYYDGKMKRADPKEYRAYRNSEWVKGDICDTMASLGAGWFMHTQRFWDLGGLDENHAQWGQMGVELSCKAWLSGGRQVVNKNTWFAHQWRRRPPWTLTNEDVNQSRDYSIKFWTGGAWPLQRYSLDWIAEKFAPVPTWNGHIKKVQPDITILYYTANVVEFDVIERLKKTIGNKPIISISQKPMEFGTNICVGEVGRSLQNIYKQILEGAKKAKTKYVALCEDDCLYVPEHFDYRSETFAYNLNRWNLHIDEEIYSHRHTPVLSQCIAPTKLLIECLEQRMAIDVPDKYCGEMGLYEKKLGLKEYSYETFETKEANLVICHKKNIMGRKYIGKDAEPCVDLAPWGNAKELIGKITMAKYGRGTKLRQQHSYIGSIIFPMQEIMDDILCYGDDRRPGRAEYRMKVMPPFIDRIASGEEFDDVKLKADPYYDYLISTNAGHSKALRLMRDMIDLYHDIKTNGVKAPLDMWRQGKKLVLHRGWRRLLIMNKLGYERVCVRLFKSIEIFRRYNPSANWSAGPVTPDSIHNIAMEQFVKLGHKATDKYWVHGYTRLYDRHLAHLRSRKIKMLEIGVFRGASLLLWKDAFPNARIYGIDKNTAIWQPMLKGQKRIKVFVGRQEDTKFLDEQVIPAGPFDVIIDDGGHRPEQQLASFESLWPHIKQGGIYVLEDLHGNYWKHRASDGPKMIERIKDLVDEVSDGIEVRSISSYYNICFVDKI